MVDRFRLMPALVLLVALAFGASACASGSKAKKTTLRKAPSAQKAPKVEKPSPEKLANSPCGNPDWAQLPKGAEGKEPPADNAEPTKTQPSKTQPDTSNSNSAPTEDAKPAKDSSKAGGDQSNNMALYSNAQPCT